MIWPAEALWQQLVPLLPGLSIEVVPRCGSTNSVLLERARQGQVEPAVLVAEQQTAGRGRQGKAWLSDPGSALLMSVAMPLAPRDWSGLSLAVGVAMADALEPAGVRIGLKWPNDLWLRDDGASPGEGRKLSGILIETVNAADCRVAVIGVGLNVKPAAGDGVASNAYASGRADLCELDPLATPPRALQAVLAPLVHAVLRFEQHGLDGFLDAYARRDLLQGSWVRASGAQACEGTAEGIAADGRLLVRTADGGQCPLIGGEISVRPRASVMEAP